ncbi:hypothetical protein FXB40_05380 [Bradyrhizobium rifense]|uniref:Uncharacterized protein n=1 Tax=Bradyrhizobium rifense TaxID=515499 RepID=A0A5D3KQF7_9BRAD|nr:hypothetical protein FXB40_05380 [Bradyrhizobium rifense]
MIHATCHTADNVSCIEFDATPGGPNLGTFACVVDGPDAVAWLETKKLPRTKRPSMISNILALPGEIGPLFQP